MRLFGCLGIEGKFVKAMNAKALATTSNIQGIDALSDYAITIV